MYQYTIDSRKLIKMMEADGWVCVGQKGSHRQYKHPLKSGRVTIPHPKHDLPLGTVKSILKQADLINLPEKRGH